MPHSSPASRESTSSPTKRNSRQRRKPTIWTREKIYKLIDLYRSSDCLWNHYSELYKNKDCRTKAIEHICTSLGITKNDYGKKVHNLRNQFNSELKKYERRLEETGEKSAISAKTCRWEHFETLMFLRPVIEPRPGYQPQCKKMLKYTFTDSNTESHASTTKSQIEDIVEIKLLNVTDASSGIAKDSSTCEVHETTKAEAVFNITSTPNPAFETRNSNFQASVVAPTSIIRDQWDAFGELIANEFRNLNSAISRKKLKRKIMQIMLEVGEEDDQKYTSVN